LPVDELAGGNGERRQAGTLSGSDDVPADARRVRRPTTVRRALGVENGDQLAGRDVSVDAADKERGRRAAGAGAGRQMVTWFSAARSAWHVHLAY
jgi:hypothetical protein